MTKQDFLTVMSERMEARNMIGINRLVGQRGSGKVAAGNFDAVILDLMMPEMDGIETLRIPQGEKSRIWR